MASLTNLTALIAATPGGYWDAATLTELKNALTEILGDSVTGNFNGLTGAEITFDDMGSTNYIVIVTAIGTDPGDIGEIKYTRDSATSATIYNSGSSTDTFIALIRPI